MKEKFLKLFFGEDMFGGGKGVFLVLVLFNVIINLVVFVFGE